MLIYLNFKMGLFLTHDRTQNCIFLRSYKYKIQIDVTINDYIGLSFISTYLLRHTICINWIHILWKFTEAMSYQTPMPFIYVIFSRNRAMFSTCPNRVLKIENSATDKHFLFLSDLCLYKVHLELGPFFPEVAKILGT